MINEAIAAKNFDMSMKLRGNLFQEGIKLVPAFSIDSSSNYVHNYKSKAKQEDN